MYGQAIAYHIDCDDALCIPCFRAAYGVSHADAVVGRDYGSWPGFEDWSEPVAIFEDTTRDTPTHCHECRALIEHDLTDEGYAYIAQGMIDGFREGRQDDVVAQWVAYFGQYMPGEIEVTINGAREDIDTRQATDLYALLPKEDA